MLMGSVCAVRAQEAENDTLYTAMLHEVYCYAPIKFKNKQQERFYWRTVRDVKKTLPYAKRINQAIIEAEDTLAQMTPKEKRRWWRKRERELFKEYEKDFRNMTASQGRMLMLLLDRESDRNVQEQVCRRLLAVCSQVVQERPERRIRPERKRPHCGAYHNAGRSGSVINTKRVAVATLLFCRICRITAIAVPYSGITYGYRVP